MAGKNKTLNDIFNFLQRHLYGDGSQICFSIGKKYPKSMSIEILIHTNTDQGLLKCNSYLHQSFLPQDCDLIETTLLDSAKFIADNRKAQSIKRILKNRKIDHGNKNNEID